MESQTLIRPTAQGTMRTVRRSGEGFFGSLRGKGRSLAHETSAGSPSPFPPALTPYFSVPPPPISLSLSNAPSLLIFRFSLPIFAFSCASPLPPSSIRRHRPILMPTAAIPHPPGPSCNEPRKAQPSKAQATPLQTIRRLCALVLPGPITASNALFVPAPLEISTLRCSQETCRAYSSARVDSPAIRMTHFPGPLLSPAS